jgi:ATP-dependent Clp protease protease subunit
MVIVPFQQALNGLLAKRIIRLGGEVNDDICNSIVAQLLYLDQKDPTEDITLYINSPGGSVTAGMAVFDTMRHIRPVSGFRIPATSYVQRISPVLLVLDTTVKLPVR